jgi:predicted O-linked N-acetylglucosamine transferase (SPINDLY family)
MNSLQQTMYLAWQHFQAGRFEQAEELFQQILQVEPNHVDALHLLGLICWQKGQTQRAVEYLQAAVRLKPDFAEAHNNLGSALAILGRSAEAVASYQRALALKPQYVEAYSNLGNALREQGQLAEAEASLRQALRLRPDSAEANHNLAIVLQAQGKLDEAETSLRTALRLKPDCAEVHQDLGNVLKDLGRLDEAITPYRTALQLNPNAANIPSNLPARAPCPPPGQESEPDKSSIPQTLEVALSHYRAGRLEQAEQLYRQILDVDPSHVDALNLLGVIAGQTERVDQAIACFRAALRLKPDFAEAQSNLGTVLISRRRLAEAVACFRQAVRAKPEDAVAYNNLGNALREQGQLDEAVATLRQALRLRPDFANAHSNLGLALQAQGKRAEAQASFRQGEHLKVVEAHFQRGDAFRAQGRIAEAIACHERALQLVPDFSTFHDNLLLLLHYREGITLRELAAAHADFERKFGAPLRSTWKPHANVPDPERRLRIGLVSPDLHRHPVGYFLIRCLENLDGQQAEVTCYSNSADHDELTARIQAATTNWRDTFDWSDESVAERIRADGIDILFDLAGHTKKNRLLVFARKPAPIQVTWAGYVGTTGLQAMDYVLADRYEIPPEAEPHYVERVLRMPHAYVSYEAPDYAPAVFPLPALRNGYVTFASFNNPAKINTGVVEVWARILCRLPNARLVLKYRGMAEPACADRFVQMFATCGVGPGRVAFLGNSPHVDLLQHYNNIDIALDPFPYNGGLTTLEALWMGVPVITCPGETFAGRHSLTHLSNLGLTQTIARDLDEYVALAASLAEELPGLAALRAGLRERMASSPLCNGAQFASDFLQLLRGVWRKWCRQQTADQRQPGQLPGK